MTARIAPLVLLLVPLTAFAQPAAIRLAEKFDDQAPYRVELKTTLAGKLMQKELWDLPWEAEAPSD